MLAMLWATTAAPAAAGTRPRRVAVIGDSITLGRIDPAGGFPTRAQALLRASQDTYTTVLNRGVGGATTSQWLTPPSGALWGTFLQLHPDITGTLPEGVSMAEAVGTLDQPLDAIAILLGTNDVVFQRQSVSQVVANLHLLQERLAPLARVVWVSTLIPSSNIYALAAIEELNDAIRVEFPDFLPLGDEFLALPNWPDLMNDSLHPNEQGYAELAQFLASELVSRGMTGHVEFPPDAFECYQTQDQEPAFEASEVDLADDLAVNDGTFELRRPFALCNPVVHGGHPIGDPRTHLSCYTIKGPKLSGNLAPTVEAQDEFGSLRFKIQRPFALCVPSSLTVESP